VAPVVVSHALAISAPGAYKSTLGPQELVSCFLSAPGLEIEDDILPTHMTVDVEPGEEPWLKYIGLPELIPDAVTVLL
jgi:hypothetical protein